MYTESESETRSSLGDVGASAPQTDVGPSAPLAHAGPSAHADDEEQAEADHFLSLVESFLLGMSSFGDVLGIQPDDVGSMAEVGDQFLVSGQVEQARQVYEGCLVLDPVEPAHLARLATCADLQGRVEERDQCAAALKELLEEDEAEDYGDLLEALSTDVATTGLP